MWTGLYLAIGGLVIGLGAFGFVLINMARGVSNFDLENGRSFKRMFMGHFGAMTMMVLGGLIFIAGVIIAVVNIFIELTDILSNGLM